MSIGIPLFPMLVPGNGSGDSGSGSGGIVTGVTQPLEIDSSGILGLSYTEDLVLYGGQLDTVQAITPTATPEFAGINLTGNASVGGTLNVTGASTLGSASVTGNETVGGTLGVTGATTLSSASVTGNATVGGTLGVTGASTLASASVTGNETVGGTLGVTGLATLNGNVVVNATGTGYPVNIVGTGTNSAGLNVEDSKGACPVNVGSNGTLGWIGTANVEDFIVQTSNGGFRGVYLKASTNCVGINQSNPAHTLDVGGDCNISGNITAANFSGSAGSPAQYSPTTTAGFNVTTIGTFPHLYQQVGNMVYVQGKCQVNPGSSSSYFAFTISLPVALTSGGGNFTSQYQAQGVGSSFLYQLVTTAPYSIGNVNLQANSGYSNIVVGAYNTAITTTADNWFVYYSFSYQLQ